MKKYGIEICFFFFFGLVDLLLVYILLNNAPSRPVLSPFVFLHRGRNQLLTGGVRSLV